LLTALTFRNAGGMTLTFGNAAMLTLVSLS
jgi:hypothetical protein